MLKLKPKRIPIRVGQRYVAIVNERTAEYLDIRPADRVWLRVGRRKLTAILDVSEKKDFKDNQIGLFAETWDELDLKPGEMIRISVAPKPESGKYIKEKLTGKPLSKKKIEAIIRDVVADDLSDIEMTYFV